MGSGHPFSSRVTSSTRLLSTVTTSCSPLPAASFSALNAIPLASTAYTCDAPALAAKKERMPVPAPTSSTRLPLKSSLFSYTANW